MRWSAEDLATIAREDELEVTIPGPGGSPRPPVVVWAVRVGDEAFVRSARGPEGRWFTRARRVGAGGVRIGGLRCDVMFEDVSAGADHAAIDAAYHRKYDGRYPAEYVTPVTDEASHGATLRVVRTA